MAGGELEAALLVEVERRQGELDERFRGQTGPCSDRGERSVDLLQDVPVRDRDSQRREGPRCARIARRAEQCRAGVGESGIPDDRVSAPTCPHPQTDRAKDLGGSIDHDLLEPDKAAGQPLVDEPEPADEKIRSADDIRSDEG